MNNNDFMLNIIAALNKQLSAKSIQGDLKTLDNKFYVKVLAKLTKTLATRELQNQLKELNNLYVQVGANVKVDKNAKSKLEQNIKMLQTQISGLEIGLKASKTQQAKLNSDISGIRKRLQNKINSQPLEFNMELKKSKLIADIEYLGKRYSKLFSNTSASKKYEDLMSNALSITDKGQLADTRTELAAFTSELKANGLASKSTGDKWRNLVDRSKDLFSAAATVRVVFSQMRQAISSTLELDTAMTNLYKVQNDVTSREQFSGMLTKWNKLAQKLSVTTESLIDSASEWSKIGFDLDMSEQLAQITAIFEKTAEISNVQASKTLISGAQAFTEIDDLGEEDYVKRVEAIGNKVNAIGNKYAISSEGIAEALQNSSAALKMANNDLDESIALITAGNKIFQSPDEMGNTLKVVSARLRGQKGELEALNEDTEGMIEGVSKVQTQILNLTKNKVNIFESDNETLKSTYDIMLEVGKVLDSLSDKDSASLLEIMFGKQRMSAGSSLLLNYEELEKVKNDSMNAANSMAEEYAKYMESAEAHITTFKEKLVETYQSFMNGDTIKYAADVGSAMLDILNYTDLLRHGLMAIASIKLGQGISTIGLSIADAAKQMNTLGGALQQIKSLPLDSILRKETMIEVGNATIGLTDKNLKLLLSQKQLIDQDKIQILSQHNLTEEEARSKLEKMGLISATNAQTTANKANTTSTITLSGALTTLKASAIGAWQAFKTAFLSNPIGITLMGLTTAISIISTFISVHNQKLEETRQKAIELTNVYKDQQNSLNTQIEKYKDLKEKLDFGNLSTDEACSIKEQLLEIQTSLIESYGNEASNLELVNGKYKEQLDLLEDLSKDKATEYLKQQYSAFKDAKAVLEEKETFNIGTLFTYDPREGMSDSQKQIYDYIKGYSELFDIRSLNDPTLFSSKWAPTLYIEGNAEEVKKTIHAFLDNMEAYIESNNLEFNLDILKTGVSDALISIDTNEELKNAKTIYDEYINTQVIENDTLRPLYQQSIQAVEEYNKALSSGEGVEDAKANLDSVQQSVQNATGELEGSQDVFNGIYEGINKDAEAAYQLGQAIENNNNVKEYTAQLKGLSDVDLKAIDFDNDNTEKGEEAFKNLMNTLGLTKDQAQMLISKLVELGIIQGDMQDSVSNIEPSLSYETLTKSAETASSAFTALRSSISSVNDAFAEQADNGSISVDTMLSLVDAGYAAALQFDAVTGACTINKDAMLNLVQAKIQNQIEDLHSLQTDIATKLKNDGMIAYESATGFLTLAKAKASAATAEQLTSVDEYNSAGAKIKALENSLKNIDKIGSGVYSTATKTAASSVSKAAKDYTKILDAELNLLDTKMKAGLLDFQSYLGQRKNLIDDYYNSGKIKANEYYSYLQKHYETELSNMDQVISAVDYRLEKEIDSYQDQIASVEERYQTEIDYLDTVIQYYEDQKAALQDANDEIDRQLKLEQALYAFEMAQNQKTKKVYTSDSGFVYKADGTAIKDASDDLRKAKLDIEIAKLEEAIKQVEKQQEALQDAMEAETAALEDIISNLEAYRNKWNEIAKEYEITQNNMLAAQLLGADWESQIINGRMETLNKFRDDYLAIQQSIVDAAWKSANEQIEAAKQAELKSQGQKGSGAIQTTSTASTTPANPAYWVYQTLGSYDTKGEASSKIGMLSGDEVISVGGKYLVVKWKNGYKSSGEASSKISSNHGSGVYKRYHTGLKEGLVGKSSFDDDFSMVQKFGLKEYEVPAILKEKEAVLTEVQIGNLADALRFVPTNNIISNVHVPDYSSLISPVTKNTEQSVVQQISVTLPNITNEAGFNNFKKEMDRLRLDAYQYAHRRHR